MLLSAIKLDNGDAIDQLTLVRDLPQKRQVYSGVMHAANASSQAVYVKLFFGNAAKKYAARDATGALALQQAQIETPHLLAQTSAAEIEAQVLVYAEIPNAQNAEDLYAHANENKRLTLSQQLVKAVAQHHNAGLLQTDLYLKNFLVQQAPAQEDKIFSLDGDGVRVFNALSKASALQNLCILLSKFDVLALEKNITQLVELYALTRGWHTVPDIHQITQNTREHRRLVSASYADKKVFRTCTDVKVTRTKGLFYAVSRAYADSIVPSHFNALDTDITPHNILKNGNTCTVAAMMVASNKIVVKRYNIKGFWHGVSRALRPTRAATSWANAHRLKLLDIPTAVPVALIETRQFGLRGKAYFLAEYIDAPDAMAFFQQTTDKVSRAQAVKQIALLFYRLYLLQISHGDMKATNIKLHNHQPVLIDLDSMRQHKNARTALKAHVRDLYRFMQNWKNDAALYNAFVKTFRVVYQDQSPLEMANFQNANSKNIS